MKDKGNGNIDDLLAEIRNDKPSKGRSEMESVDDILAGLGKNDLYIKKQVDINENKSAPKSESFFDEFEAEKKPQQSQPKKEAQRQEEPKQASPKPRVSGTKSASFFADEMFASTFANQLEPTTKQEEKVNRKKQKELEWQEQDTQDELQYNAVQVPKTKELKEEQAPARTIVRKPVKKPDEKQSEIAVKPVTKQEQALEAEQALPIQIKDSTAKKDEQEAEKANPPRETQFHRGEDGPRKIENVPQVGTLRDRILSAAKQIAFATEEDEEYFVKPKAFAVYAQEANESQGDTLQANAKQEKAAVKHEENEKTKEVSEPTREIVLPLAEQGAPTLEFSVQESEKLHKRTTNPIVISPDGVRENIKAEKSAPVMISEVDDKFREFFGETVAVSREEIEKGLKGEKAGKLLRKFFGARDELTGELTSELTEELTGELTAEIDGVYENDFEDDVEETDDYNSPSDAPAVEGTLQSMRATASMRVVASFLTSLLLIYLGLSARTGLLPAIPVLDPLNEPLLYLVANFALLLITGVVCINSIISGITGFFKEPTPDTLTLVGFVGALIQNLAFLITPNEFDPVKVTLFAPVAALMICANAWGKRMQCATICKNFDTVSVGYDHSASYLLKNRDLTAKVCQGLYEPEPALLVSRPTALVKGFLSQSFSQSKSAKTARIMSYVILISGILCGIYAYVQTDNVYTAISAFAALGALCAPLAATLMAAVPVSLLHASASKVGAVVAGWSSIEELGTTNAVLVNAKDLFPPDTVRLHGIKTFEKERIDLAILYAASVLVEGCETLRDIFLNVIENKTEMLFKVESLTNEPGFGFSAWIEHTRVIVGNRAMMMRHDIDVPSLDYEMKYTKGERCPIYLSVSGKLFGMFLVSYQADNEADEVLYGLVQSGMSVVVKSDDFNMTSSLICDIYGLNENMVKVLTAAERDALHPQTAYLPESEGILTHLGTFPSFVGGLRAASGAASGVKMAMLVQVVAIIVGLLLCGLLVINKGLTGISLTAVLLYQIAWSALTMLIPLSKRS